MLSRNPSPEENSVITSPGAMRSLAVCGLGRIGWHHAECASSIAGFRLAAICDTDERLLEKAADNWKVPAFSSWEGMFSSVDADTVVVATPSHLHLGMALAALEAGYNVILEKPAAASAAEVGRIISVAEETGRTITVCQSLRYQADVMVMKDVVQSGALGRLDHIALRTNAGMTERTDWQIHSRFNGGQLSNLGVHLVDSLLFVCGASRPVKVFASMRQLIDRGDTEDVVNAVIEFEEGFLGEIEIYRGFLDQPIWHACGKTGTAAIVGSLPEALFTLTIDGVEAKTRQFKPEDFPSNISQFYRDLGARQERGQAPAITMSSVLRQMHVMDAIRESSRTGRAVSLNVGAGGF